MLVLIIADKNHLRLVCSQNGCNLTDCWNCNRNCSSNTLRPSQDDFELCTHCTTSLPGLSPKIKLVGVSSCINIILSYLPAFIKQAICKLLCKGAARAAPEQALRLIPQSHQARYHSRSHPRWGQTHPPRGLRTPPHPPRYNRHPDRASAQRPFSFSPAA